MSVSESISEEEKSGEKTDSQPRSAAPAGTVATAITTVADQPLRRSHRGKRTGMQGFFEEKITVCKTSSGVEYYSGDFIYYEDSQRRSWRIGQADEFRLRRETMVCIMKLFYRSEEVPEQGKQALRDRETNSTIDGSSPPVMRPEVAARELFICDSTDNVPISTFRGKCQVTHYPEWAQAYRLFRPVEDQFFYTFSFNPETLRLSSMRCEIKIGDHYQADLPACRGNGNVDVMTDMRPGRLARDDNGKQWEELMWIPGQIDRTQLNNCLIGCRSITAFAVLSSTAAAAANEAASEERVADDVNGEGEGEQSEQDGGSEESVGASAHAIMQLGMNPAVREFTHPRCRASADTGYQAMLEDDNTQHVYDCLHANKYKPADAINEFVKNPCNKASPIFWRDEEERQFARGIRSCGKNFNRIMKDYLPHRTMKDLIRYYYYWKFQRGTVGARNQGRTRRSANFAMAAASVAAAAAASTDPASPANSTTSTRGSRQDGKSVLNMRTVSTRQRPSRQATPSGDDTAMEEEEEEEEAADTGEETAGEVDNDESADPSVCRNCGVDRAYSPSSADSERSERQLHVSLIALCLRCRVYLQKYSVPRPVPSPDDFAVCSPTCDTNLTETGAVADQPSSTSSAGAGANVSPVPSIVTPAKISPTTSKSSRQAPSRSKSRAGEGGEEQQQSAPTQQQASGSAQTPATAASQQQQQQQAPTQKHQQQQQPPANPEQTSAQKGKGQAGSGKSQQQQQQQAARKRRQNSMDDDDDDDDEDEDDEDEDDDGSSSSSTSGSTSTSDGSSSSSGSSSGSSSDESDVEGSEDAVDGIAKAQVGSGPPPVGEVTIEEDVVGRMRHQQQQQQHNLQQKQQQQQQAQQSPPQTPGPPPETMAIQLPSKYVPPSVSATAIDLSVDNSKASPRPGMLVDSRETSKTTLSKPSPVWPVPTASQLGLGPTLKPLAESGAGSSQNPSGVSSCPATPTTVMVPPLKSQLSTSSATDSPLSQLGRRDLGPLGIQEVMKDGGSKPSTAPPPLSRPFADNTPPVRPALDTASPTASSSAKCDPSPSDPDSDSRSSNPAPSTSPPPKGCSVPYAPAPAPGEEGKPRSRFLRVWDRRGGANSCARTDLEFVSSADYPGAEHASGASAKRRKVEGGGGGAVPPSAAASAPRSGPIVPSPVAPPTLPQIRRPPASTPNPGLPSVGGRVSVGAVSMAPAPGLPPLRKPGQESAHILAAMAAQQQQQQAVAQQQAAQQQQAVAQQQQRMMSDAAAAALMAATQRSQGGPPPPPPGAFPGPGGPPHGPHPASPHQTAAMMDYYRLVSASGAWPPGMPVPFPLPPGAPSPQEIAAERHAEMAARYAMAEAAAIAEHQRRQQEVEFTRMLQAAIASGQHPGLPPHMVGGPPMMGSPEWEAFLRQMQAQQAAAAQAAGPPNQDMLRSYLMAHFEQQAQQHHQQQQQAQQQQAAAAAAAAGAPGVPPGGLFGPGLPHPPPPPGSLGHPVPGPLTPYEQQMLMDRGGGLPPR